MFIGRENELCELNRLYLEDKFHMLVLYGRRRVGKTTMLSEFCKDKDSIFFSATQSNDKLRTTCCPKMQKGELPILFTSIGRWRGTDPSNHKEVEIDIVAGGGDEYLISECRWKNEKVGLSVLSELKKKADAFKKYRKSTHYILFSKSGFTDQLLDEAEKKNDIILISLSELCK